MKNKIKYWLIPIGIQNLLKSKLNPRKEDVFNVPETKNNEQFKNIHAGKRCFVLASGPSINRQNLKPLQNEICIAVSSFFNHPDIDIIKPKYHVIAPMHPPFTFEEGAIVLNGLQKQYKHSVDIFIGTNSYEYSHFNCIAEKHIEINQKVYPINYDNSVEIDENNLNNEAIWDITKTPFSIRTVIYSAIQLAHYMGFTEIVLLGCDHDYLNDVSRTENHHFYKENESFSDKKHLSEFTRERWFFEYYKRWKDYRLIQEYLNAKGVKVVNATDGGMLDVFPRKDLKSYTEL
ncbi:MAG: hypothetical protein ACOVO1_11415 [Chitinophagaceae bacterium]